MWEPTATAAVLRRLIGRQLSSVTEALYWYEGRRGGDEESLLHLWLHFDGEAPIMVHSCGDRLELKFSDPYASYDMQEHGETRGATAQAPDLLGSLAGQRLLDAAVIQGYTTQPSVGGLQLRFESGPVVIASLGDEWLLTHGSIPEKLRHYLSPGEWLREAGT
jgi:hypothetical protein